MMKTLTTLLFTSLALATPSLADSNSDQVGIANPQAFTAQLQADANQKQLRRLLAAQGYIVTSELVRDESGRTFHP